MPPRMMAVRGENVERGPVPGDRSDGEPGDSALRSGDAMRANASDGGAMRAAMSGVPHASATSWAVASLAAGMGECAGAETGQ